MSSRLCCGGGRGLRQGLGLGGWWRRCCGSAPRGRARWRSRAPAWQRRPGLAGGKGGNKDAVAGVLRLKEEVTDLAVGEHPWSMLAEQDRHDEKLAQWKRLLELAKSRATAARQDEVGITSHVFTMSSKERWKDIRARLPESVRQLDKCLRGSDEVNPVLATKDFDAIGSDFVEWSQSSQVPRGMPTTPEGFCGLLYDQCRDDSDAAKYAREQKCREY